ncbi:MULTISPECIES: alpha-L-glutamate ligase-like protein [unclassified Thioalkalivibrio]|uniref:alpha-L-glutamate ligase-like protein n=1 Tax=unclassified Thioalkalivibrio TaxID=2621013 RepID=UPI00036E62B6|nr:MULTISPECIES: alpha-L-glutamate ligase-like protein [unclassified Thioalkalivibrio]PYG03415.1 alpha-L-glutamate ligase-like protein [Thioalkalivibrio sp. ALE21]
MAGWWPRFVRPSTLRRQGILGMNARNGLYIAEYNARRHYPRVDDKRMTKQLASAAGLAVPELIGVIHGHHQLRGLERQLREYANGFVIKPAHGAAGDGIMVISGWRGERLRRAGGRMLEISELQDHVSGILSGMYSLGGRPDVALIEERVEFSEIFAEVTHTGVPDIRTVVYRGYPVMAMLRLPTQESDGKANLHQGAVGTGIDLASGHTLGGVQHNQPVWAHPDTEASLVDLAIPGWDKLMELAAGCYELSGLGYLGVDVVIDRRHGPLILELNARPGLAIQIANGEGLRPRLRAVDEHIRKTAEEPQAARAAWAAARFGCRPAGFGAVPHKRHAD